MAALLAAACGTRVPHDEVLAVAQGSRTDASRAPGSGNVDPAAGPESAATGAGEGDQGAPGVEEAGSGSSPSGNAPSSNRGAGSATGPKAPLKIGMIGDFSGVVGAQHSVARDSFKAWASMVNDRGGINGHPIELYVANDGGDASRDVAIARDFVENRGVIALVNFFPAIGGADPVARYAEEKQVPIVGGATYNEVFNQSPVMFPQTTGLQSNYFSHAKVMKDAGLKKVAIVYCAEAAACQRNTEVFKKYAQPMGLEIVYEASVLLGQPDFTAECLNARAAGADVFYPVTDGNSANRLARSCARQNYRPTHFAHSPSNPPDPALEGAIATTPAFPWVLRSGSPAIEEYAAAMERYQPKAAFGAFTGYGWLSGKLFEKAAANVGDTPTRQDIFEGLWAMKGETLGGLAPPLTFERGKPAPDASCAFYIKVEGGQWAAPKGLELVGCR